MSNSLLSQRATQVSGSCLYTPSPVSIITPRCSMEPSLLLKTMTQEALLDFNHLCSISNQHSCAHNAWPPRLTARAQRHDIVSRPAVSTPTPPQPERPRIQCSRSPASGCSPVHLPPTSSRMPLPILQPQHLPPRPFPDPPSRFPRVLGQLEPPRRPPSVLKTRHPPYPHYPTSAPSPSTTATTKKPLNQAHSPKQQYCNGYPTTLPISRGSYSASSAPLA